MGPHISYTRQQMAQCSKPKWKGTVSKFVCRMEGMQLQPQSNDNKEIEVSSPRGQISWSSQIIPSSEFDSHPQHLCAHQSMPYHPPPSRQDHLNKGSGGASHAGQKISVSKEGTAEGEGKYNSASRGARAARPGSNKFVSILRQSVIDCVGRKEGMGHTRRGQTAVGWRGERQGSYSAQRLPICRPMIQATAQAAPTTTTGCCHFTEPGSRAGQIAGVQWAARRVRAVSSHSARRPRPDKGEEDAGAADES